MQFICYCWCYGHADAEDIAEVEDNAGVDVNTDVYGSSHLGTTHLLQVGDGGEREECHRSTRPSRPYARARYENMWRGIPGEAGANAGQQ